MPEPKVVIGGGPRFTEHTPRPGKRKAVVPRRLRRVLLAAVFLLVVAWAAGVAYSLVTADHGLTQGKTDLDAARQLTTNADLATAAPSPLLRLGTTKLTDASKALDRPWMAPFRHLPYIGRQLVSARDLSRSGAVAAKAVADALDTLHAETLLPPAPNGRVQLVSDFLSVMSTTQTQLASIDLGPNAHLYRRLASARADFVKQLDGLSAFVLRATSVARAGLDLLQGHHRMLLLLTNNAEMRAGSGMANQVGVLQIDDGHLKVENVQSVYNVTVPSGAVTAPADFGARWGWLDPTVDWQELLADPRFDATAPVAAAMWKAAGNQAVDGVIAVDPFVLQAILQVVGPVSADGHSVTSATVLQDLFHDQYVRLPNQDETQQRHDEIADVTTAATTKLEAGGWSASSLGLGLADAVRGRHLMIWSPTAADETAWTEAGAGGTLGANSLMVSVLNRSRSKADQYLVTNGTLTLTPANGHTNGTLTVTMADDTPPAQVPLIAGPGTGASAVLPPGQAVGYGDYIGLLAVDLPGAATNVRIGGQPTVAVYGPDGPVFVIGAQYVTRDNTRTTVKITFDLPTTTGSIRLEPSARAPSTTWVVDGSAYTADVAHTIAW